MEIPMAWSHQDSWEVCLVLRVLEALERQSEYLDPQTGEVRRRLSFVRERSISRYDTAAGKRFDFSVLVDKGEFRREFLIEIHGQQHYQPTPLGDEVRESDRLKANWAQGYDIPLLILADCEITSLHSEAKLEDRIRGFLGISG
jgi:hypothetical protein